MKYLASYKFSEKNFHWGWGYSEYYENSGNPQRLGIMQNKAFWEMNLNGIKYNLFQLEAFINPIKNRDSRDEGFKKITK